MNKLFAKIAALSLGFGLAVGVGVNFGGHAKEAKADTASWDATAQGFSNEQQLAGETYSFSDSNVTITFGEKSGNGHKYFNSGTAIRSYGGNTFTIACSNGNITSITLSNNQSKEVTADVGTYSSNNWSGESASVTFTVASGSGNFRTSTVSVTYTPSEDPGGTSYSVIDSVENGSLNKSSVSEGATLSVTISPDSAYGVPESVSVTMGGSDAEFTYLNGVVTVEDVSGDVEITGSCVKIHGLWEDDPYTVAEARAAIDAGTNLVNAYTFGIISQVDSYNSTYHSIQYWISDDGTTTDQLEIYSGKGLNGANFAAVTDVEVGAEVLIKGTLKKYNSTYEYDKNNFQVSYSAPSSGDIEITFDAAGSYELGDTGTFTASTAATNPVYTWSVDDSSVLSVNASTGAFEALKLGTATVTVSVSADEGSGEKTKTMVVNGKNAMSISDANTLAASLDSGVTTIYYVYVEGYVKEFATSKDKSDNPRAFDIMSSDETSSIMVYTNTGLYPTFIVGLQLGDYVKIKANVQNYNGTYELTNPEKVSSSYSAISFASKLLELTGADDVCGLYDGTETHYDDIKTALASVWSTLSGESNYGQLDSGEIAKLVGADAKADGTTIEKAMNLYDIIVAKYNMDNFISDRDVANAYVGNFMGNDTNSVTYIVVASLVVVLFSTSLILVKKKKSSR